MDWTGVINIVIKILGVAIGVLITTLYPKFKSWLDTKISEQDQAQMMSYIKLFVEAAEQSMKSDDPTGEARKEYVVEQLQELGVTITEQINAMIEAQVLNVNKKNDK